MPDFSFHKGERLTGYKAISALFQSGRGVNAPPFRFIFLPATGETYPVRTAITVPKRLFRKAVERNLLKRRIREAYRQQKAALYQHLSRKEIAIHLVIQYQHREILPYHVLADALQKGLDQLIRELSG